MSLTTRDLLGNDIDDIERDVLDLYARLKELAARDDLPPCVERNAKQALAAIWNAANDLDLVSESLLDSHGV